MPTNDERREAAENLRTMCSYGCRYAEQFYELLNETVMREWDFHSFQDVADRLADLIEPEERTCHIKLVDVTDSLGQKMYRCSECGALMTDDACFFEGEVDIGWFLFCPNCGAKVVEE